MDAKRSISSESKRTDYKSDKDFKPTSTETKSKEQLKKELELSWQRHKMQEEYLQKESLQQKLSMYR